MKRILYRLEVGFSTLKNLDLKEEIKTTLSDFSNDLNQVVKEVFFYPENPNDPNLTVPGRVYSPLYADGYNPTGADLTGIKTHLWIAKRNFKKAFRRLRRTNPDLYDKLELEKVKSILLNFIKGLKNGTNE